MIQIKLTKEAKDKKVINPETRKRIKSGLIIPKITSYWKNRETDGDITFVLTGKDKEKADAAKAKLVKQEKGAK